MTVDVSWFENLDRPRKRAPLAGGNGRKIVSNLRLLLTPGNRGATAAYRVAARLCRNSSLQKAWLSAAPALRHRGLAHGRAGRNFLNSNNIIGVKNVRFARAAGSFSGGMPCRKRA
jgi:hypothetical protein